MNANTNTIILNMNAKLKNIIIIIKNLKNVIFALKYKMLKIISKNVLLPYINVYFVIKIFYQLI